MDIEAHAAPGARATKPEVRSSPGAAAPAGLWQVQVGAFRNPQAADAYIASIATEVPEVGALKASRQAHRGVTRARIAGIADEASAQDLCGRLSQAGRACFVVRPRG